MKFSSISLIAATLAATVGGTIAVPAPLQGRVNLFEREVDGDKLFRRGRESALKASQVAAKETKLTADFISQHPQHGSEAIWRQHHQEQSELNTALAKGHIQHNYDQYQAHSYNVAADAVNHRLGAESRLASKARK